MCQVCADTKIPHMESWYKVDIKLISGGFSYIPPAFKPILTILLIFIYLYIMMSWLKAPYFDIYRLFCATHSHVLASLRSVLNICHGYIAPAIRTSLDYHPTFMLILKHVILYVNISAGMSKDDYSYHNIIRCRGQKPQNFRDLHTQNLGI